MRAWIFQDTRQKARLGATKCPWSVGWYDPEGRKRSKRIGSKSMAEKFQRKMEGQLAAGTYENTNRKQWSDFRAQYERDVFPKKAPKTRKLKEESFDHFERIIKPARMDAIKTTTIDRYSAARSGEKSKRRKGELVSPATINKELRDLKAALRKAYKWEYIARVPDVEFLREPEKLADDKTATQDDFANLYEAAESMTLPRGLRCEPSDWWRGVLCFAYMTGWRVSEVLALKRDDVDLEACTAITRWASNKGKRDGKIQLHPIVVDHIEKVLDFGPLVFYWPHHERTLWAHFTKLKEVAKVTYEGAFHGLRYGFASENATSYDRKVLQAMMRHASPQTTERYIAIGEGLAQTAEKLAVPKVLKVNAG